MIVYKYNHVFSHIEQTLYEYYNDIPQFDNTVVVLGYNVLDSLQVIREKYPKHKVVIYQLEHLYNASHWVNKKSYNLLRQADEIWDFDEGNIHWMRMNFKLGAKFKPLMYTKALKVMEKADDDCDIDVLYYGYLQERRAKLW